MEEDSNSEAPADEQEEEAPCMAPAGSRGGPRREPGMGERERVKTYGAGRVIRTAIRIGPLSPEGRSARTTILVTGPFGSRP